MTTVICFALQKGGVGKTTSAALSAYLLAEKGYRVLALDLDMQANMTQIISGYDDLSDFEGHTLLEALIEGDVSDYIRARTDLIHYVPSDDYLATLDRYKGDTPILDLLRKSIADVKSEYDYIVIDTPPALSIQTINALNASDYVVTMFQTAKFAYDAIPRFESVVNDVKATTNPKLEIIGILATLNDSNRKDAAYYLSAVQTLKPELVFNTVIKRKAAIGRIDSYGLYDNKEIGQATELHRLFIEELIARVDTKKGIIGEGQGVI